MNNCSLIFNSVEFDGLSKDKIIRDSKEYVSIFVVYADIDVNTIVLQEEEVSEIKCCSKEESNDFIDKKYYISCERI